MKTPYLLTSPILALCLAVSARASDLAYLTKTADAVVVGATTSRLEYADRVSFDLSVERVVKGDATVKLLHIMHPWTRTGVALSGNASEPISAPIHGLWFLQLTASGEWDILPANGRDGMIFNLYLPAAQVLPQRYATNSAASALDSIVLEFAAGAEADGSHVRTAIELLKTTQTPAVSTVAAAYLTSPVPAFQSAGIALVLAQNQPDSIGVLTRLWPTISSAPGRDYIISSLRDSYRDPSPVAVRQLAAMTNDAGMSPLRPAAIRALAAIHTKEALPTLAGLLGSDDPAERMAGVFGLSSFANGCPLQTPDNVVNMDYLQFKNPSLYRKPDTTAHFAFRRGSVEQESELTSFWLTWWNQHKSELTQ